MIGDAQALRRDAQGQGPRIGLVVLHAAMAEGRVVAELQLLRKQTIPNGVPPRSGLPPEGVVAPRGQTPMHQPKMRPPKPHKKRRLHGRPTGTWA